MTETAPIRIEDLVVDYGAGPVLDGLSLFVPAGSIRALLGGAGAGKSTTLGDFARLRPGAVRHGAETLSKASTHQVRAQAVPGPSRSSRCERPPKADIHSAPKGRR